MSTPENKSYLAASINAWSPWSSRSSTPKPDSGANGSMGPPKDVGQCNQDHSVTQRHRIRLKDYPRDCPQLNVHWFHAVDIPKRKAFQSAAKEAKPLVAPKKYAPFSLHDSRSIEAAFQKLFEETSGHTGENNNTSHADGSTDTKGSKRRSVTVPVNEDFLFDVNVERRELAPAYWQGPVYDVRRGTWFYSEGSTIRPCDENLAMQLEEGYLKLKPWRVAGPQSQRSASQPRSRPMSLSTGEDSSNAIVASVSTPVTPKTSLENLRDGAAESRRQMADKDRDGGQSSPPSQATLQTYRLFGAHMNSVVTYQDPSTAWIVTDDIFSRMSSTVYQRFAGGAHFAGVRVVRGYIDPAKKKDVKESQAVMPQASPTDKETKSTGTEEKLKEVTDTLEEAAEVISSETETRRQILTRQMSSFVSTAAPANAEQQEEEVRKRDEKEIQDDYRDQQADEQGREIEHLLLVTHGIGQRLGLRLESVNFVHDVNTLRKTLKAVYNTSADLQALNQEIDKLPKNCRLQVLPICWRHLLDFPKQSLKHNRKEHDLADSGLGEDEDYPSLDDISVEGVPAVRNLITDLALDILLYQSPAYKGHITRIVLQECNRIYKLFCDRNPDFKGKVSLLGHSLGSAIMFDILCRQDLQTPVHERGTKHRRNSEHALKLDFEVEDFYALGSPIGLFQMLKGRTIAARRPHNEAIKKGPLRPTDDPFLASEPSTSFSHSPSASSHFEITTSSPKCAQLFNIFHPTDPISYRIEPLISHAMAALKPQPLPYTKKGIFDAPVGQGLSGIGARVGQTVSGLFSTMYSGVASNLLNRSLGISATDAGKLGNPAAGTTAAQPKLSAPLSLGAGTNLSGGVIPPEPFTPPSTAAAAAAAAVGISDDRKRKLVDDARDVRKGGDGEGEHPPTLIDTEIETLYSGFEKRWKSVQSDANSRDLGDSAEWMDIEERGKKLKREEAKVRALNANGRVDYSIQEGAFDISLIASIASHLSYWGDEDVSHFMISQLLSRQRVIRRSSSRQNLGR